MTAASALTPRRSGARRRPAKFRRRDQAFFGHRRRLEPLYASLPPWFIADHWPLFAGTANIARFLAIYELAKRALELPGHLCELGCWHGTNLVYLAKVAQLLKPESPAEVIGFDAFEGLQAVDRRRDHGGRRLQGQYRGSLPLLQTMLRMHGLQDAVQLVKGRVEETLPAFLQRRKDIRFSLIYLDLDLYGPTRLAVELLYPRLLKGGLMVFDEYNMEAWPGETRAVHEVLGPDVVIRQVPFTRQPTGYLIK